MPSGTMSPKQLQGFTHAIRHHGGRSSKRAAIWFERGAREPNLAPAHELVSPIRTSSSGLLHRPGVSILVGIEQFRATGEQIESGAGLLGFERCRRVGGTVLRAPPQKRCQELRSSYEAMWGHLEAPGRLRVSRQAWRPGIEGEIILDTASGAGGSIAVAQEPRA